MNEYDLWRQLIAAVEYVSAITRPELTVASALDEALRWWIAEHLDPTSGDDVETTRQLPWDDPDPLRATLDRLLTSVPAPGLPGGHRLADVIESAIGSWLLVVADSFNDRHEFDVGRQL